MLHRTESLLSNEIPSDVTSDLFKAYRRIHANFSGGDFTGIIQNLGPFVEGSLRICQWKVFGKYTPRNSDLRVASVVRSLEVSNTGDQHFRIFIPRVCLTLYTFRSRKWGSHIKVDNATFVDSAFIIQAIDWVLVEFCRLCLDKDPEELYRTFSTTAFKKVPLVGMVEDGFFRTLNPKLSCPERVVLLLGRSRGATEKQLLEWSGHKMRSKKYLQAVLKRLNNRDLVHKKRKGLWVLTSLGLKKSLDVISKYQRGAL